jgi:glycosyltransferase involved in cell wall biosynthesis
MMKVSIITVCYNSEKTIGDTCASVLNQSYDNIEYIIIDGASSDSTVNIIRKYENKFSSRMKWISEEDNGIYDAMNKGIRMATGDIVGIINSDDYYPRNTVISEIVNALLESKAGSVFSDVQFVAPHNEKKIVRYYSSKIFSLKGFQFGIMPAHGTFFTYKFNYDKYGVYETDYTIAADFELLLRFLYVHRIGYYYHPTVSLVMRTGGISTSSHRSNLVINREIKRALNKYGISTSIIFLYSKYLIKAFELFRKK